MDLSDTQVSPTSFLPPLARLSECRPSQIKDVLQNLRSLYWPPPPVISLPVVNLKFRRRKRGILSDKKLTVVPDSGYASAEEDEEDSSTSDVDVLRSDPFERAFAIKWITGFIRRSDTWTSSEVCSSASDLDEIIDEATSILSSFSAGDKAEDGASISLTRTFSFPFNHPRRSQPESTAGTITVELNDAPLSDTDHTSVGLQSWASSILMAERMSADPEVFGLMRSSGGPLRVLELGAGTGMLSIVVSKILQAQVPDEGTKAMDMVVATDYHPDVLANLTLNLRTNHLDQKVGVHLLDWEHPESFFSSSTALFDTILAADVIYHPEHARWIKRCVQRLLVPPSISTEGGIGHHGGFFYLMIPLRSTGRHEGMDRTVHEIFGDASGAVEEKCDTLRLGVIHWEKLGRKGNVGRADECGYKLFKIGWIHG